MMNISFEWINSTFFAAASDVEGGFLGIQKSLTMIVIYCVLTLSATLACCKLMHLLPDTIFKWIGGASSTVLGMMATHAESGMMKAQAAVGASMQMANTHSGKIIGGATGAGKGLADLLSKPKVNKAQNGDNTQTDASETKKDETPDTSVDIKDFGKESN